MNKAVHFFATKSGTFVFWIAGAQNPIVLFIFLETSMTLKLLNTILIINIEKV